MKTIRVYLPVCLLCAALTACDEGRDGPLHYIDASPDVAIPDMEIPDLELPDAEVPDAAPGEDD